MRKSPLSLLALIALLAGAQLAQAQADDTPAPGTDRPAWVVVLDDPRPPRRRGWANGVGYGGRYTYDVDPALARLAKAIAKNHRVEIADQWPIQALGVHCIVVHIPADEDAVLKGLRRDPRVRWVQPLNDFDGLADKPKKGDPYRGLQPALDTLNVASVRDVATGRGIRIAIVDSAVEIDHPDLQHAVIASEDFVGRGSKAERHGTGIAGVVAAARGNEEGIAGVAPDAGIYAFRACWDGDSGRTQCNSLTLSRALDRVVSVAPHIVNLSLTGPPDPLLDALITEILAQGSLVVVADSTNDDNRFPSAQRGVIWATFNPQRSSEQRLPAPGADVLTAQPGHGYDFMSGSSLSAAHVTGVLALLHEALPNYSDSEILMRLNTSRNSDSGVINACYAVLGIANARCQSTQQVAHSQR